MPFGQTRSTRACCFSRLIDPAAFRTQPACLPPFVPTSGKKSLKSQRFFTNLSLPPMHRRLHTSSPPMSSLYLRDEGNDANLVLPAKLAPSLVEPGLHEVSLEGDDILGRLVVRQIAISKSTIPFSNKQQEL